MSFLSRLFGRSDSATPTPRAFVAERDPRAPVLDVRTSREYASGHVAGAIHVDVNAPDFEAKIDELASVGTLAAERPIYLYCRSGARSGKAVRILRGKGYQEAYNVGGLPALRGAGAQVVT